MAGNAQGAFQAYDNRFVRSKVTDINSVTNMMSSIVNNVSLGSRSFIGNAQNIGFGSFLADGLIQGNQVYATTGIPGFLILWDKARAMLPVKAVSGFGALPFALVTRNPKVTTMSGERKIFVISPAVEAVATGSSPIRQGTTFFI